MLTVLYFNFLTGGGVPCLMACILPATYLSSQSVQQKKGKSGKAALLCFACSSNQKEYRTVVVVYLTYHM